MNSLMQGLFMKKLFIVYLLLVIVLKAEVTTVQDLLKDAKKM